MPYSTCLYSTYHAGVVPSPRGATSQEGSVEGAGPRTQDSLENVTRADRALRAADAQFVPEPAGATLGDLARAIREYREPSDVVPNCAAHIEWRRAERRRGASGVASRRPRTRRSPNGVAPSGVAPSGVAELRRAEWRHAELHRAEWYRSPDEQRCDLR